MSGWKLQGYWYKAARRFLNDLATHSIRWCMCAACCVEGKADRRSLELCFGARQAFGGDFGLVFRVDRRSGLPARRWAIARRIMVHDPIERIKTVTSRSTEERKDGTGDWILTKPDGTTVVAGASWPREPHSGMPAFELYATPDGREPPIFGTPVPWLGDVSEQIRAATAAGELDPGEVADFCAEIRLGALPTRHRPPPVLPPRHAFPLVPPPPPPPPRRPRTRARCPRGPFYRFRKHFLFSTLPGSVFVGNRHFEENVCTFFLRDVGVAEA